MCSPIETVDQAEVIKDRLYFVTASKRPTHRHPDYHLFSTDDELVYCNYNHDFGPLSLAMVYRFCEALNRKLQLPSLAGKKIVYYTGLDVCKRANAAFLMGCHGILYLGRSADEAYLSIVMGSRTVYPPFRDALAGPSVYNLTLLDTLHAVARASQHSILDFAAFNVDECEHYERVENGDMNWIVPKKLLAFASPHAGSAVVNGYPTHAPESYLPYFKRHNVGAVVRLNSRLYDAARFTGVGIAHYDLCFVDGGNPSDEIVQRFLSIAEKTDGAVAVHCKAGLGRTGTLIGCYLMKHFKFTAAEAIAWTRIARPGSVLGLQQLFLQDKQTEMWTQGESYRRQQLEANVNCQQSESVEATSPVTAAGSSPQPDSAPLTTSLSQGDQLNRLKMQRCRQNQGQSQGQGQTVASQSVKRPYPEVTVNRSSSLFRSLKRLRARQ